MGSFFTKACRYSLLASVVLFAGQTKALANHAKAIEVSDQTYPIFSYVLYAIALLLLTVLINIWRINRLIKKQEQKVEDFQAAVERRKFLGLLAIMLLIGLFSVALFYFFILNGIRS